MNARNLFRNLTGALALSLLSLLPALRATAQDSAYTHYAGAANISGNSTYLDNPFINANPKATLMVTPSVNPYNQGSIIDAHNLGVWYDNGRQRWAIFHQDGASMTVGAAYNVWANVNNTATGFVHKAAAPIGKYTYIDNPNTNLNPNAVLYVTQLWNPYGFGGVYNDAPIGVFYDSGRGQWAIQNVVSRTMPVGAAFFVFVDTVNLHKATPSNTFGSYTQLDDPWSITYNSALTFVTINATPRGIAAPLDQHAVGVKFISGWNEWSILNMDGAAMPLGANFNTKQMFTH